MLKSLMSKKFNIIWVFFCLIILLFSPAEGNGLSKDVTDIEQTYENIPAADKAPINISGSTQMLRPSELAAEKNTDTAKNSPAVKKDNEKTAPVLPQIGDTQLFLLQNEKQVEFTVAAVNEVCVLYVPPDTKYISPEAFAEFYPANGIPTKSATAIIQDYKDNIYNPMQSSSAPEYYGRIYKDEFVSILLYAFNKIDQDNELTGIFLNKDLLLEGEQANHKAMVHLNISKDGYDAFLKGGIKAINGTLAHELQHLINFSEVLYNSNAKKNTDTWLDEGLAGTADILYTGEIEQDHFLSFLAEEYGSGLTYVPTDEEWQQSNNAPQHYGSTTLIMEQYACYSLANQHIQPFNKLLKDARGSSDSKLAVGDNYFENINLKKPAYTFDAFFDRFILDLAVDSKFIVNGITYDYRYHPFSPPAENVGNMWRYRQKYRMQDRGKIFKENQLEYDTVGNRTLNLKTTEAYRPDLKLLKLTCGKIELAISDFSDKAAGLGVKYYIVYPEDRENAGDSLDGWINAPKTFKELKPNTGYSYTARSGSYFALLAVGFSSPINGSVTINEVVAD